MPDFQYFDGVPPVFADDSLDHFAVLKRLGETTLIRVQGKDSSRAVFVSTLQHGNEDSGWRVLRDFLKRPPKDYPWDLYFMIGNVPAALWGNRYERRVVPPEGEDMNRCWDVAETTPLKKTAGAILRFLKTKNLIASLDIHNTTGVNPPFVVVTEEDPDRIQIASHLSGVGIFSPLTGCLTTAMGKFCLAFTMECGQRMLESSKKAAEQALQTFLKIFAKGPRPAVEKKPVKIYKDLIRVLIPKGFPIGVEGAKENETPGPRDFLIPKGLDLYNFRKLPAGTVVGRLRSPEVSFPFLMKEDGSEKDVASDYFYQEGVTIKSKVPFTPVMMSLSERAIHIDCFFYLGEDSKTVS
ncbi:MAG: succinylglutamate desuccinylase/aspartoacylase family protein [Deltaproteobacteria bacterium]|nr:succinylglutamate desuccinylase/aspartoacylase family protein [Deltaproteobacteria bacterium]